MLAVATVLFVNYRATKRFTIAIDNAAIDQTPPEYLFSFAGPEDDHLTRPVGVMVDGDEVYVSDSSRHKIDVFSLDGERLRSFGEGNVITPLYFAKHPKTGQIWVTDRRVRAMLIFEPDGTFVGEFDPKLPEDELPTFDTGGIQWQPIGLAFAPDGSLYVTEILNGHRLLAFDPDGKFVSSVGVAGLVEKATDGPEVFQFPNTVKVHGEEVWVADSNNRRLQIFGIDGQFKRMIATEGLPRGFDFLQPFRSDDASSAARVVVVDTLSHDGTIWTENGDKVVVFGSNGVLEGQFSYPNDASVDANNRIYIADTSNSRVQVWGWPEEVEPIPTPRTPAQWAWCLSPLLLLLLPLLLRKRRYLLTPDFMVAMIDRREVESMVVRRVRWVAHEDECEQITAMTYGDQTVGDVVDVLPMAHSASDAQALIDRLEISQDQAKIIAIAQRVRLFCTDDPELRRIARTLEIEVASSEEFVENTRK